MTGAETNPSLSPGTPPASQNNTVTDVGVIEPAEGTPAVDPAVNAPSAAGEQESVPYPSLRDDGRPRTRIVVRPRWVLPDEKVEGAASGANDQRPSNPAPASETDRPSDYELARLNWVHSHYRGTVAGAIEQYVLHGLSHLQEGEEETPRRRVEIEYYRPLYDNVVRDLDRADQLLPTADVTKASLTYGSSTSTTSASSERIPSPVDNPAFAKRILPTPGGPPSPLLIPPFPRPQDMRSLRNPRSGAKAPTSADHDSDNHVFISARFAHDPGAPDQAGRILDDASSASGWVSGQRYAQLVRRENRAITGNKDIDRTTEDLLHVLEATVHEIGSGWGPLFGIRVHSAFAKKIKALNLPGIGEKGVEASFNFKQAVDYGLENSIRVDIVLKDKFGKPIAVYDLKTGNAKLRPARVRELAEAAGVPIDRVIELRYNQLTAERRW